MKRVLAVVAAPLVAAAGLSAYQVAKVDPSVAAPVVTVLS